MFNLYFRQWFDSTGFEHHCLICKTNVRKKSKHCGQCNRCTEEFDHHCAVLNNCIGSKNYQTFIYLINCTFVLSAYHILIDIMTVPSASQSSKIIKVLLGTSILLNLLILVALGKLIFRHFKLQKAGLSTYEYLQIQEGK